MNKYLIHIMICVVNVVAYLFLNNINISPITLCHLLIKILCCNRSLTDKDIVYEPDIINVPMSDVEKVGNSMEKVIEDVGMPKIKNMSDAVVELIKKV